ncbi:MAG: Glu-tRNA(Gln) amidotransferase subunit GatD [Nanoarchaeota archaeon]
MRLGDSVSVRYDGETIEGVFISEDSHLVIKLRGGYNIALDKRKVKKVSALPASNASAVPKIVKPKKGEGAKIVVLHTGGTIASRVDYATGAVIARYGPEEFLSLFPEVMRFADVHSRLVANIQSEMMRFDHYNLLVDAIEAEVKAGAKGIVVTHGTDTLSYTSAALGFACAGIGVPVVLVGSQRSSDRPSSDAYMNLLSAVFYASRTKRAGVSVCMHGGLDDTTCDILDAFRCRKMHTTRRDAFRQVNGKVIAKVSVFDETIQEFDAPRHVAVDQIRGRFDPRLKVGWVRTHPHMRKEDFSAFASYDGLIIEGTGLGHVPNMALDAFMAEHARIAKAVKALCRKMPVVLGSQCVFGRVMMDVYTPQRMLKADGVLGDTLDLPVETLFIKLAWLLSTVPRDQVASSFGLDLAGELSSRSRVDGFP